MRQARTQDQDARASRVRDRQSPWLDFVVARGSQKLGGLGVHQIRTDVEWRWLRRAQRKKKCDRALGDVRVQTDVPSALVVDIGGASGE
jgi:hypothetical protein